MKDNLDLTPVEESVEEELPRQFTGRAREWRFYVSNPVRFSELTLGLLSLSLFHVTRHVLTRIVDVCRKPCLVYPGRDLKGRGVRDAEQPLKTHWWMTMCLSILYFQMLGVSEGGNWGRMRDIRRMKGKEKQEERLSLWASSLQCTFFSFCLLSAGQTGGLLESRWGESSEWPVWWLFHFGIFCIVSRGGGWWDWAGSDSLRLREVKSDGLSLVPMFLSTRISKSYWISSCSQLRWWKVTSSPGIVASPEQLFHLNTSLLLAVSPLWEKSHMAMSSSF